MVFQERYQTLEKGEIVGHSLFELCDGQRMSSTLEMQITAGAILRVLLLQTTGRVLAKVSLW